MLPTHIQSYCQLAALQADPRWNPTAHNTEHELMHVHQHVERGFMLFPSLLLLVVISTSFMKIQLGHLACGHAHRCVWCGLVAAAGNP